MHRPSAKSIQSANRAGIPNSYGPMPRTPDSCILGRRLTTNIRPVESTARQALHVERGRGSDRPGIKANRAPVLSPWGAVVAERLGHPPDLAVTLGHAVAGSSARAKARSIGIADDKDRTAEKREHEPRPAFKPLRLLGRDGLLNQEHERLGHGGHEGPDNSEGACAASARGPDRQGW
jgi:hypothetical protein